MAKGDGQNFLSVLTGALGKGLEGVQAGLQEKRQNDLQNLMTGLQVQRADREQEAFALNQHLTQQKISNAEQASRLNNIKLADMLKSPEQLAQDKVDAQNVLEQSFIDKYSDPSLSGPLSPEFLMKNAIERKFSLFDSGLIGNAGIKVPTPFGDIQKFKADKFTDLTVSEKFIQKQGGDEALFGKLRGTPLLSAEDQFVLDNEGEDALLKKIKNIPQLNAKDAFILKEQGAEVLIKKWEDEDSKLSGRDLDTKKYIYSVFKDPAEASREWMSYLRADEDNAPQLNARDREVRAAFYDKYPVAEARDRWIDYIQKAQGTVKAENQLSAKDALTIDAMNEVFGEEETTRILAEGGKITAGGGSKDASTEELKQQSIKLKKLQIATKKREFESKKILERANAALKSIDVEVLKKAGVSSITNIKDLKQIALTLTEQNVKRFRPDDENNKLTNKFMDFVESYNQILADVQEEANILFTPTQEAFLKSNVKDYKNVDKDKLFRYLNQEGIE